MIYELEVDGKIIGKERPRVNMYTGNVYTPGNTKEYERYLQSLFVIKYPKYIPIEKKAKVTIIAYFEIPKSTSKKNTELMLSGEIVPTKKPDIDNIAKVILDGLNKLAFKDDNLVSKIEVEKRYAEKPKVYIKVEEY